MGKDIISMENISKEEILDIMKRAKNLEEMSRDKRGEILKGIIVATLFFEPSTRTKMSFECAAMSLGANVLPMPPISQSSLAKGESFKDTIKMFESYSDIIVIRHPKNESAEEAGNVSKKPVINAGDGTNQHPSQTLLDMYTILKERGTFENLEIAFVGDLKYGRTVHSLCLALAHFNAKMYFIAPDLLQIPKKILDKLDKMGIEYELSKDYKKYLHKMDVFYMTRIQRERFEIKEDYEKVKGIYIINKENIVNKCKDEMMILHPLPRVDEISEDLDDTKHALYFKQAANGVPVRQAMLMKVLGL